MKKRVIMLSLWVAIGCLFVSGRFVSAQESTGPLEFSIKLEVETTDNRDSAADGFEESNTDFMVKPRLDAMFDMERLFLDFYYEPTIRYRSDARADQNDDEFLHDLGVNLRHALTPRLTFKVNENFNITDDPSVEQNGSTLRRDSSYTLNRVNASLTYDITRQSRVEVAGWHRMKSYDEAALDYLDEESVSGGLTLYRAVSRTVTVFGEARMEDFTYEDDVLGETLVASGSLDRSFTASSFGLGMENEFYSNCRASLRAGYTQLEYADDGMDSEGAPYVQAMIKLAAVPSARLTASATHRLRDSDVFPFASQKATDIFAGVELDATEKVTFSLSANYRLGEYEEESLPSGRRSQLSSINDILTVYGGSIQEPSGDETAVTVKAGVSFEISDNTVLKLSQQYEDEDSDVSTSFTRNATRVTLSKTF